MGDRQFAGPWQPVADLIRRLELVNDDGAPQTAAQVARMSTAQLLQDPVRVAIYRRGWEDRVASIQRTLQQQPQPSTHRPKPTPPPTRPQRPRPRHSPTGRPQHHVPAPAPIVSGETPPPPARERTEAQQARNRKKFQQLKDKKRAREQSASQNHRLAKQPAPDSSPEAACSGLSIPAPVETIEVDEPAPKSVKLEEMVPSTSREQPNQTEDSRDTAEVDWLAAPGLPLEEYPETVYDNRFYTPVTSPRAGRRRSSGSLALRGRYTGHYQP
ncbi:Uncharacterized protein FWK35_00028617 [Aphis craccivora]|uniref:Uncharacterized protein n=1 Tax=Aphis craccivora TaxID=307492 RepID=A0A6G0XMX0_APHCR|nr:Uncharacterized protein FWK35_00028617 [Aphis craccivora]